MGTPGERGTWRVDARVADVALEDGLARRRQVHDVVVTLVGASVLRLNASIADNHIASHSHIARRGRDEKTVRVSRHCVLVEHVVAAANDADAEVVCGIHEAITIRRVQPEPAVDAVQSYAAARLRAVAVADSCISLHNGVKSIGHPDAGRTIG